NGWVTPAQRRQNGSFQVTQRYTVQGQWRAPQGAQIGAAGTETGDAQLADKHIEMRNYRLGGLGSTLQYRCGLADQVRTQADGLGGVHAVTDPTGGYQGCVRQRPAGLHYRLRSGDAPVDEGHGHLPVSLACGPFGFDPGPAG